MAEPDRYTAVSAIIAPSWLYINPSKKLYFAMSRVMRKPAFCICENKDQRLCFRSQIVQSLYFLNPRFHASSHLLWLYSPVCVGPGQKPRRPVFSQRRSILNRAVDSGINRTGVQVLNKKRLENVSKHRINF